MNKEPKVVAVDLTPVLPGGDNGGAKIFALELLRHLAQMAPRTEFVLLTQSAAHDELATMDRPNMRRMMVLGAQQKNSSRVLAQGLASRILPHLPGRLQRLAGRIGSRLFTLSKRNRHSTLLRKIGADLLFCPFTAPTYFEPAVPAVCTIYDLQYKTYPEFFALEDVAHRDATFNEACRKATALAAISDYSRDTAIMHGKLDPARIRTIHLRMAQRINPGAVHDKAILDRLKLIPQRYLIYPANFWKHKNHEMLLTAFGMAAHNGLAEDIKLVCTGAPGARQKWMQQAAQTMFLGERILFPGYLPHQDLATLIANGAGVVFPSLYEGFGLPVIEAMAMGVPVACSNITSLPEVAADAAILFNPKVPTQIADAIRALVDNQPLRAELIEAGRQRAAEFADVERMAREYWDLFLDALTCQSQDNLLTGVYADGWVGPRVDVRVASSYLPKTLEIELMVPDWMPHPTVTVAAHRGKNNHKTEEVVERGRGTVVTLPLDAQADYYHLQIGPVFVPAQIGLGDDHRQLTAMVRRCAIVSANGELHTLFGQERAT